MRSGELTKRSCSWCTCPKTGPFGGDGALSTMILRSPAVSGSGSVSEGDWNAFSLMVVSGNSLVKVLILERRRGSVQSCWVEMLRKTE